MSGWFSRLFRSRTEVMAERAEVEGRFEDAARLYAESGSRAEAFRVLMRAAETAQLLSDRRALIGRAYGLARTDELRAAAKKALGLVTLAEAEVAIPRTDEERARLREAAQALEATGAHREASRAYRLLGDRESIERTLMLAGDVEGYEREADAEVDAEKLRLRRRGATESFEGLWRSGDRGRALDVLDEWARRHSDDAEARLLLDERRAQLVSGGSFEALIDGVPHSIVGAFPCTLGREGRVVLRGASVSREHAVIDRDARGELHLRDNDSRNGTLVRGLPLAASMPLASVASLGLGADLELTVTTTAGAPPVLEVDRGMDRGRRVLLLISPWEFPLGTLRFIDLGRVLFEPRAPVDLTGQRVVAPIVLARGDRIEAPGGVLEVLR